MKQKIALYIIPVFICLSSFLTGCNNTSPNVETIKDKKTPVDYVNPYIGNISHLLVPTYPTVHLPNSMLRVYPERADYTTEQISGLPIAVTSHRGSSAFNISPISGTRNELPAVMKYTYDNEQIKPYYYSVYLDEDNIQVEYAPSHQSGIYTIVFENGQNNQIVINTRNGKLSQKENSVSGYQLIDGGPTTIYVYLETQQTPNEIRQLPSENGINDAYVLTFDSKKINLRYGISFIDADQAEKNLKREINTYDVKDVAQAGRNIWNETLSKIEVAGDSEEAKTIFYTSLYRTYERMICISEDGRYYSATQHQVLEDEGTPFYTDDWIWDTYRATHPLRILVESEMEKHMIKSYIRMAQQSEEGWMPTFPEVTGDSHRMNGNHSVAVIWDAYCKGLKDFDLEAAYQACKGALTEKSLLPWVRVPNTELDVFYHEKGYFPALQTGEAEYVKDVHHFEKRQPVAVTMGTCYDHWCLSQIAKELGYEEDYKRFLKASYNYRNLYKEDTGFFHPKDIRGNWVMPFDYRYSGGQGTREYYSENNAYVYRWDVPHNIADLINLMGSPEKFIDNMNETYREPLGKSKYAFYAQIPDHTGNVGQFSMANEPSLHIPYVYNYAGQPWMTQKKIRTLLEQWFRNDLMGVPGDEDGGGLSAFVVFSQIGFYPVTPGSPTYNIGSPAFNHVKMKLSNGNIFEIEAKNCSAENKYIQSASLNGQEWNKPWFHQDDIVNGGKLVLEMGAKANKQWAASLENVPPSAETIQ